MSSGLPGDKASEGFRVELSPSNVGYRSLDVTCPKGKVVQGFAIRALALQVFSPSIDENTGIGLQMVFDFSLGGRTEEFERDEGVHNR
jgi:hypothetical protein